MRRRLHGKTWGAFLLLGGLVLMTMGCSKIKEASDAAKEMAQMAGSVREMATNLGDIEAFSEYWEQSPELSEDTVRSYYLQIAKLQELYPEYEFQNPPAAAMQAGLEGENLQSIITRNSDLSFQEYSSVSIGLLKLMTQAAAAGMSEEMTAAMEQGVQQLQDIDAAELSEEQRQRLAETTAEQQQALASARAELDTAELAEYRSQLEMVARVRKEVGIR